MSNLSYGITRKEIIEVINRDAVNVTTTPDKYRQANEDRYLVLCNTWLLMCYEVAGPLANRVLLNAIKRDGLLAVIDNCAKIASRTIDTDFTYLPDSPLRALFCEDPRETLQLLRYPKKFSPAYADVIEHDSINKFLEINRQAMGEPSVIGRYNGLVLARDTVYPRFLISGVKRYCAEILGKAPAADDVRLHGNFSSGYSAEGDKTFIDKVVRYSQYYPYFKSSLYPISENNGCGQCELSTEPLKIKAVPKSYKAARIIAMCPTVNQFFLQGVRYYAERAIARSKYRDLIVFDDQTINQEWSRLGSVFGTYCTIDLSSASDSISDSLARQVLPKEWYALVDYANPKWLAVGQQKYKRWIFQSSGNATTFCLESVIFLAITLLATEYVALYDGRKCVKPRVFGDDLILDSRVYDTVIDFLGLLGFTVNTDKSFGTESQYRESCGAEWWCGLDMTTRYFPRTAIVEHTPEYLQSLCALQHRIFSYKTAEDWLCRHVRTLASEDFGIRDFTSSEPGTECDDLWEDYPYYKVMNAPFDHKRADAAPVKREAHYALTTSSKLPKDGVPYRLLLVRDMFRYAEFLQFGPSYDEYGYSEPPASVSQDFGLSESAYRLHRR